MNRHITEYALRQRFSLDERATIDLASIDNPTAGGQQRAQAAALRVFLADLRSVQYVDLDSAQLAQGLQMLEGAGLIAAGRAAAIIQTPIAPTEAP